MAEKRGVRKWRDTHYVTVYELACAGLTRRGIAQAMALDYHTIRNWLRKNKAFKDAYERGCKRRGTMSAFKHYLYGRLPKKLRRTWRKIMQLKKNKSGIERVQTVMERKGKIGRQHLWLHAYFSRNFNKTEASRLTGIDFNTVEGWINTDPEFHELFDGMMEAKGDFFESALVGKVKEGDTNAILFVNKTYNAKRGYGATLKVEHSGKLEHVHEVVPIKDLNLELDLKKALLEAIRERSKATANLEYSGQNGHANGSS